MVPRVVAEMIEDTLSISDALEHFRRTGFSRIPVFHEDPDSVIGVVLLKDLLGPIGDGRGSELAVRHARTPYFVPETKPILDLLQEMRASHNHMVIVVDEHGGTAGVATIEDIVEEIVGEIADEFDPDYRYIDRLPDGAWLVDGRLPVSDSRDKLGLDIEESEEYDTLAGWVLSRLGHIPVVGETVRAANGVVRVQLVRRRRVARLKVTVEGLGGEAAEGKEQGEDR
jgi:putative hemolysin